MYQFEDLLWNVYVSLGKIRKFPQTGNSMTYIEKKIRDSRQISIVTLSEFQMELKLIN